MKSFIFVAIIFAFQFASIATAAPVKLSFAYSTFSASQAPAWIAKDRGLFEKYGLDVQLLFIRSSSIGVPALVSGAVAVAVMGGADDARANLTGSDTILVGRLKNTR